MNDMVKIEPRADVLSAISKAMGGIRKVAKEGKNTHDNYNFASIDDFLAMVNPICADAGLIFHMEEVGTEDFMRKGKFSDNAWMRQTFAITVFHLSGQSLPPVHRSVEVLRNGAQAYGSAQSYALKQFLRALLLIPTGDKDDADYGEKGEGEIIRPAPKPATISADQFQLLRAKAEEAGVDEAAILKAYSAPSLEEFPSADFQRVMKKLQTTIDAKPKPNADLAGDELPY